MASLSSQILALSLLTAGEQAHSFSSFMPSHFTVKNWVLCAQNVDELDENVRNLRSGYLPSLAFGLGLGAVVSMIAKSPLPLLFAAGTGAVMMRLYETALPVGIRRSNPLELLGLQGVTAQPPAPAALPSANATFMGL